VALEVLKVAGSYVPHDVVLTLPSSPRDESRSLERCLLAPVIRRPKTTPRENPKTSQRAARPAAAGSRARPRKDAPRRSLVDIPVPVESATRRSVSSPANPPQRSARRRFAPNLARKPGRVDELEECVR